MAIIYTRPAVPQYPWTSLAAITSEQAAPTTNKSEATIDGYGDGVVAIIRPDDDGVAMDARFKVVGSDGDSNVVNIYAVRDSIDGKGDDYTLMVTLALTVGTQTDDTNLYVDTIVSSNEKWIDDFVVISDAANGIGHVSWNTQGYKKFAVIATTLGSTSLIVDYARI